MSSGWIVQGRVIMALILREVARRGSGICGL